jgi:hypothetical protein
MSHLSQTTAAPSYLPLDIRDSLKEDARLFALMLFALGLLLLAGGRLLKGEKQLLKENC